MIVDDGVWMRRARRERHTVNDRRMAFGSRFVCHDMDRPPYPSSIGRSVWPMKVAATAATAGDER